MKITNVTLTMFKWEGLAFGTAQKALGATRQLQPNRAADDKHRRGCGRTRISRHI